MGIVSRIFDTIEGIYWFPIVALALFIIFFGLIAVHTMTMKKSKEQECGALPFENDEKYQSREV
ncbi:MAG: CcoQ/FixQ family Cbb3-type cytochrome c oxidase assembly chaperone [Bacteroidota bacterium]